MRDVLEDLDAWVARGDAVALATVVSVRRSAPRPPGAKMAVNERGEISGAVSGGCVEGAVVEVAHDVLRGGAPRLLHFGIADSDAWDVGLPCGGEIAVFVERYDARLQVEFAHAARAALVTVVSGPSTTARLLVRADGRSEGHLGTPELAAAALAAGEELMWAERPELRGDLFVDVVAPPPRLMVFGAVDYSAALCRMARAAGWRPYVIDPRGRFATATRFPDAEEVVAAWPREALARLGGIDRATYVAVLTHDPKLDDAALEIALRSEAPYVGAMGSRRAQTDRRRRLVARGLTEDELARIAAPIGLDLGGLTAEETALSIMAEVVAVRNGREGGRLSAGGGRIHAVAA